MFDLRDDYVWDFWLADDGDAYHLFFLHAPKSLGDPELRHHSARIGHATSSDLEHWTRVADVVGPSDAPAFDDTATWTGSVVRRDGLWYLFYTGMTLAGGGSVQSVGYATSPDLMTWTKGPGAVSSADGRWYELVGGTWHDEAWRDPWVLWRDGSWHMLVTARANHGDADNRGVIGYATSPDLVEWTTQPPLSEPGQGFGHLEVPQVWKVDGQWVLMFSVLAGQLAADSPYAGTKGAVWIAMADGPLGPFDLGHAHPILQRDHYVGRFVNDRNSGRTMLLAFRNEGADGTFVGGITDPMPVRWDPVLRRVSLDVTGYGDN